MKLDAIDHDHLLQTLQTKGWKMIEQRLQRMVSQALRDAALASRDEHDEKKGFLLGVERALAIPATLLEESKPAGNT